MKLEFGPEILDMLNAISECTRKISEDSGACISDRDLFNLGSASSSADSSSSSGLQSWHMAYQCCMSNSAWWTGAEASECQVRHDFGSSVSAHLNKPALTRVAYNT